MVKEFVDICDDKNHLLGIKKDKNLAHKKGLWHRSVHIWVYNSNKEVLIQLRAKNKDFYPNLWDISVAGHISSGETPINASLRELNEEIRLKVNKKDLKFFKIIKQENTFQNLKENEFSYVYLLEFNKNLKELKLQESEVQEIKFISINKLIIDLKNSQKYVPHGDYWFEILEYIKKISN